MAYDENKLAKLKALKELATRVQTRLEALEDGGTALKAVTVDGNALKFFNTTDTATATATYTIDLPAEMFLDAASTLFVPNFTFNAETYPDTTNPDLDGKPVFVLAVKTKSNDGATVTTTYSFIDVSTLIDTYTASDTSVTISDYKAKVNISAAANNSITLQNDGLHVDITEKVDKVTTATAGHITAFDSDGGIADSGYSVATDVEVDEMLDEIFGASIKFGKSVTFTFADENAVIANYLKELKNLHSFTSVTHDNSDNTAVHIQGKVATGSSLTPSYVDTDITVAAADIALQVTLYDNTDDSVSADFNITYGDLATIYESNNGLPLSAFFNALSSKTSASNFALTVTWANNTLTLSSGYNNPVKFYCEYTEFVTPFYENTSAENQAEYFKTSTMGPETTTELNIVLSAV